MEKFSVHKYSRDNQGVNTSEVFAGKFKFSATKKLYSESSQLISSIIKNLLPPNTSDKKYELTDLGSFKGELLNSILLKLPEYFFHTTAVDLNSIALAENVADQKIVANLDRLPIKDNSQDIVLARYVLNWNSPEQQKNILLEITRITKGFAIIQHVGADNEKPNEWRNRLNMLFNGQRVPKLKRENNFFLSRKEVEIVFKENNIFFKRFKEIKVNNISDVFTERFNLNDKEVKITKDILAEKDYAFQTTWLVFSKNI